MTNYEKICKIIESWKKAKWTQKDSSLYFVCYSITLSWSVKNSWWINSTEEYHSTKQNLIRDEEKINGKNITISIYQEPVRYPKVWDKVEILESVKQIPWYDEWLESSKEMIWWPFEVKSIHEIGCCVYTKNKLNFISLDYRHIAPRVHDEPCKSCYGKWSYSVYRWIEWGFDERTGGFLLVKPEWIEVIKCKTCKGTWVI